MTAEVVSLIVEDRSMLDHVSITVSDFAVAERSVSFKSA
jgi:hypothetical protein